MVDPTTANSFIAILFLLGLLVLDKVLKAATGKPLTAWLGKARKDADALRDTVHEMNTDLRSIRRDVTSTGDNSV